METCRWVQDCHDLAATALYFLCPGETFTDEINQGVDVDGGSPCSTDAQTYWSCLTEVVLWLQVSVQSLHRKIARFLNRI